MSYKTYKYTKEFTLECGEVIPEVEIAYHTYGKLNEAGDNVIWVCHALTANSEVFDWWDGLFGEECRFNPNEHFIICANIIGSCYGTTGPLSVNPQTGKKYYHNFPKVTIRDVIKGHELLSEHLGIEKIKMLIGSSLGGHQAMEWAILNSERIENLVLIATNARHSAWGIAFNESQRLAIQADHTWKENSDDAGRSGLICARSIALLSYRNYNTYIKTQTETDINKTENYRASSYQQYQGEKLNKRFNAYSYYLLSEMMDSHNVGRNRGSVEKALNKIGCRTLVIGVTSDYLFPIEEQHLLNEYIPNSIYKEIDSFYGHDGFLIETDKLEKILDEFLG